MSGHVEPPMIVLLRKVYSTREQAREVIASRPDASPTMAVYLRCDKAPAAPRKLMGATIGDRPGVEIITPSFAHEVLKAWPKAQLVGASEEIAEGWAVAAREDTPNAP